MTGPYAIFLPGLPQARGQRRYVTRREKLRAARRRERQAEEFRRQWSAVLSRSQGKRWKRQRVLGSIDPLHVPSSPWRNVVLTYQP